MTFALALVSTPATAGAGAPEGQVPVDYSCFVTFQGGSTVVPFSLTYGVQAPETARSGVPFRVVLDTPPWVPNPDLQSDVRDVEVVFRMPDNAEVVATWLSGGDVWQHRPKVTQDGDVLRLKLAGPLPAGESFDLPAVNVLLNGTETGPAEVTTGGTSFDDPSYQWTRNSLSPGDPPGTLRPFDCQPEEPALFTTTEITPFP
jgi:dehydratase